MDKLEPCQDGLDSLKDELFNYVKMIYESGYEDGNYQNEPFDDGFSCDVREAIEDIVNHNFHCAKHENNPLTLEQLQHMGKEPVWIKDLITGEVDCLQFDKIEPARIHAGDDVRFKQFGTETGIIRWCCKYGEYWLPYAKNPELEEKL